MDTAKLSPEDVVVDETFCRQMTVSMFDLETMIMSLLTDSTIMQPKNIAPGSDVFTEKNLLVVKTVTVKFLREMHGNLPISISAVIIV
jgi:hypothetical protein